ncbi:MAG: tetratricopeptide repeat protein [bacterium]|nr:tetratricopeptide repeat protein [bacterium]
MNFIAKNEAHVEKMVGDKAVQSFFLNLKETNRLVNLGIRNIFLPAFLLWVSHSFAQKDSLQSVLQSLPDDKARVSLLCDESTRIMFTDNTNAKELATQALELSNRIDYNLGKIESIHQLGQCHYAISDFDVAIQYSLESLEMAEKVDSKKWISENLCSIGLINMNRENFDQALDNLKKSYEISKTLDDEALYGRVINSLGVCYWEKGDYENAIIYFEESLEFETTAELDSGRIAVRYNNVGITNFYLGKYDEAQKQLRTAIAWSTSENIQHIKGLSINNLGKVHTALKKYTIADSLLLTAYDILEVYGNHRLRAFNLEDLIEYNVAIENYQQAFSYQQTLMAINDSILNESKDRDMANLLTRYDAEKKDREILKQQLDLERQQQNVNIYIAIIGFFVMFLLTLGYFLTRLRKNNAMLESSKQELARQNVDLADTMDELVRTQSHLIHSEKMATLGTLFAGIAHEINTPLGAIKASAESMISSYDQGLEEVKNVIAILSTEELLSFFSLMQKGIQIYNYQSSSEERKLRKQLTEQLEADKIENADDCATYLASIGIDSGLERYEGLLRHPENLLILKAVELITIQGRLSKNILMAANKTNRMIYAMRTYSFKGGGEMSDTDIKETIETALILYNNRLKKGVETVKTYNDEPLFVSCYPDEITQVWVNLIHNALDAMESSGKLAIDINQHNGSMVQISISDTGSGISTEDQKQIFDPFFTTKRKGEGTGLGLDIVKRIIDKHEGQIDFQSNLNEGTTFNVYLKKNKASETSES